MLSALAGDLIGGWVGFVPTFAAPFLLAVLGLIITERGGTLNLGAEGVMAVGALLGVVAMAQGGHWSAALVLAVAGAVALSALHAFLVVLLRLDQVLAGLVVFTAGIGFTGYAGLAFTNLPIAGLPELAMPERWSLPAQDWLTWLAFLAAPVVWYVLARTELGLRIRACGDDAAAADAMGLPVTGLRFGTTLVGGVFLGLAGAHLSLVGSHLWVDGMVAGRGWIAVVLVVFVRWNPLLAVAAAVMFGAIQAAIPFLQARGVAMPIHLVSMAPYLATIAVVLIFESGRRRNTSAPRDLAKPYLREDRN
ncbi:ABC transporter permease [Antarctobacter sp.]|uniref:ABC transporter permease n=1 Tax=Antarctobacter sp. TaxID=1872577 RepID=UPI002B2730FC|nr:ABC transporter permease [Antarctobacter sp.]